MKQPLIKLAIKHFITIAENTAYEKNVFEDTFAELWIQAQAYNPGEQFSTLADIVASNPKAQSLQYKTRFAIGLYVDSLQHVMPNVVDTSGKPLKFDNYQFEIICSNKSDKSQHAIALTYITKELKLLHTIGNFMVLLDVNEEENKTPFTVEMKPGVSIIEWREE